MASVEEVDPSDYSWPWKDMDIFLQKLPGALQLATIAELLALL